MIESKTHIRVRYADTDQMGIVYHSHYLEWFEAGRAELFREMGIPYTEIEKRGTVLPVIEAHLKFKRPARYDQILKIVTMLKEIPKVKLKIFYNIYDENYKNLLVDGYTVHSFINSKGKPTRVPFWLKRVFEEKFNDEY